MALICWGGMGKERQRRQGRSNGIHPTYLKSAMDGAPCIEFFYGSFEELP